MRKYLCMDMKEKKTGKGNNFPTNCREVQQMKDMEINEKIRYFRKQRGLSQELLAERTGINVNTIRKYEIGIRKPKVEQLKKIADGLEISVIEFLDIEIENEADLIAMLKVFMIGVGSALVSLLLIFVCYSLTLTAKRADENLLMICEKNQKNEEERGNREMESQRDILRVIEKEIKKGSAPVAFAGLGFSEECYHLVDSQAKMNQLLDYFFRNEEYAALADRQVKSNIYAEMGKRLNFRSARSDRDRKNMEVAAKRWIKKKHPTFDGDVYVENIRCFLDISQEELEKRKCTVNEQDITALIFSQKHLEALYLQCLMHRRNAMQEVPELKGLSETCDRIYKLQDVDVLFQCLLMDQMDWEEEKLYVQFSTVYLLLSLRNK